MAKSKNNSKNLQKRQKISKANQTMFLWVAAASVVLSVSVVISVFLIQKIIFNTKVNLERNETISNLDHNNSIIGDLKDDVRALNANAALNSIKANPDDKGLQVILDALPADANSLALGGSLQRVLASNIGGLTVESLSVTSVDESNTASDEGEVDSSVDIENTEGVVNSIPFTMVLKANSYDAFQEFLTKIEKSIRTVNINTMSIESGEDSFTMTIEGVGYYEPGKKIELKDKTITNKEESSDSTETADTESTDTTTN